jgi:hypothetical protein
MWPRPSAQIQTSVHAGGMTNALMRAISFFETGRPFAR